MYRRILMEKVLKNATLGFLIRENRVLLAKKARHIGVGCWNGYGGGIEGEESPEESFLRELHEEGGIRGNRAGLDKRALVDFHNTKADGEVFTCRVHVFVLTRWSGEPETTSEMLNPTWFPVDMLPVDGMMLADKYWIPRALAGERIYAEAWYGPRQETLLREVQISRVAGFA